MRDTPEDYNQFLTCKVPIIPKNGGKGDALYLNSLFMMILYIFLIVRSLMYSRIPGQERKNAAKDSAAKVKDFLT